MWRAQYSHHKHGNPNERPPRRDVKVIYFARDSKNVLGSSALIRHSIAWPLTLMSSLFIASCKPAAIHQLLFH